MKKIFKLFKEVFTSKKTQSAMIEATFLTVPILTLCYLANKWNEPLLYLFSFIYGLGLIGTNIISYMDITENAVNTANSYEKLVKDLLSDRNNKFQ